VIFAGTLSRYFARQFLLATLSAFFGVCVLIALVDFIELMRRTSEVVDLSALTVAKTSLYRVPQTAERILPFCVLVGAMSCYLNLSRRMELVVARSSGLSAWQFVAPAMIAALALGFIATTLYNPISAALREISKQLEAEMLGHHQMGLRTPGDGFWLRQRGEDSQSIINARSSSAQGAQLAGITIFTFDRDGHFSERIDAKSATLEPGQWRLTEARSYSAGSAPVDRTTQIVPTNLTPIQVRENFATPETVSFWQLPLYIQLAEHAGLGAPRYRLQYHKLLSQPFLLAAMVLMAAAFSLRFFRFGGVQKMVLIGVASGFLLYVLAKVTDDLSKAMLMPPVAAAWLPVVIGGLTGFVALLHQEDG
jgi:lipopolysaccharide export system permease protein